MCYSGIMTPCANSVVRPGRLVALLLSALALVACAETPEPGSATEAAEQPSAALEATAVEAVAAPASAPAVPVADPAAVAAALPEQARAALPQGAAEAPGTPRVAVDPNAPGLADIRAAGEAIQGAIQAAAEAEAQGTSSCERGFVGIEASIRSLGDQLGGTGARRVPDRERFMEACNELPGEVQQCLVMSYALANRAECERRKNELDPALRERIQSLMRGD